MKDHMRKPSRVTTPTPSLTDPNAYELGQQVEVTVTGTVVRIQPAGDGRATLKIDTALAGQPLSGQWIYVLTDEPNVAVRVLEVTP